MYITVLLQVQEMPTSICFFFSCREVTTITTFICLFSCRGRNLENLMLQLILLHVLLVLKNEMF